MVKLVIIGLDCAEPSLMFDRWRDDLPNISRLMEKGSYGKLESCIPAITVPAWNCMMSGRDPGELGIYGFRNRLDRSYNKMGIANSNFVKVPRLWDILGDAGWKVAVLGVPGTYPPKLVKGCLVSCFLTPDTNSNFTHPESLQGQITNLFDRYLFDVPNFRSLDKHRILKDIYYLCNQTFSLAHYILDEYEPDLLTFVEMGVDRIHHALWKYMDDRHPLYEKNSPFAEAIYEYYRHLDNCIGKLLLKCGEETAILVVSDHGGQPLMGGFCLNEWLKQEGYLEFTEVPNRAQVLEESKVNWRGTKAWGAGGYYGRVFLNVEGREAEGIIPIGEYEKEREELIQKLESIVDPEGNSLGVKAFKPQEIYRRVRGIAPDLIVYFQNMAWRSVGTVGLNTLYTLENDTGPDDANHAPEGLMIFVDPENPKRNQYLEGASIYDILPTLLDRYKLPKPTQLRGKTLEL